MDLYPPVEERSESAAREYRSSLQFCIREVRELRCPRICFPPFHSCRGHTTLSKLPVRSSLVSIGRALCALPSANEAWWMGRSDGWTSASPLRSTRLVLRSQKSSPCAPSRFRQAHRDLRSTMR